MIGSSRLPLLMQKRDPLRSPVFQSTQLLEIPRFIAFPRCPRYKVCQRTAMPGPTVAIWNLCDAVVDVEADELVWLLLAREQLQNDSPAHGRDLRLTPLTVVCDVCCG